MKDNIIDFEKFFEKKMNKQAKEIALVLNELIRKVPPREVPKTILEILHNEGGNWRAFDLALEIIYDIYPSYYIAMSLDSNFKPLLRELEEAKDKANNSSKNGPDLEE